MKRKRRNFGTESSLAESDKIGSDVEMLSSELQRAVAEENSSYKI